MIERVGILLDHQTIGLLLDAVEYRAKQLGQELKATGKDAGPYKGYLRSLVEMRNKLVALPHEIVAPMPEGAVVIEGEKESE